MAEPRYSIDRDLTEAKSMADHLIPYVYGDQLYGSIGGMFSTGATPSLTIGALLMRIHRLRGIESALTAEQRMKLTEIEARNEAVRSEWSVHYNEKMVSEANSRLHMIETFFAECAEDPRSCYSNYQPEAMRRTIVQDIDHELHRLHLSDNHLEMVIRRIDGQLHRYTSKGDFIWAEELQPAYPPEVYWWLYASPPRAAN